MVLRLDAQNPIMIPVKTAVLNFVPVKGEGQGVGVGWSMGKRLE